MSACLRLILGLQPVRLCTWSKSGHRLLRLSSSITSTTVVPSNSLYVKSSHARLSYTTTARQNTTNQLNYGRHYSTTGGPNRETSAGGFQLVYTGPLKGAVKALKIFSLTTAVLASCGGPVLVWLGKESVPVAARLAISSLVLLVGLSTTAILHWLLKGYITHLYYQPHTQRVAAYTFSLLARRVRSEFEVLEMKPPSGLSGFSTFQAQGKSYFMHTDVFPDKHLLSGLLDSQKVTNGDKKN